MPADDKELELLEELLDLIRSSVKTQVMFVAVETGIAEQLAGGPLSHTEVAARVECPASAVKRLLDGMAAFGLCVSSGDQYVLTDKGHILLKVGAWAVWYGNCTWAIWGNLLYSVKTGRSAREFLAGLTGYDYLLKDSRMAGIFNLSMGQMSRFVGEQCVRKYQGFRDGEYLLDVGGGYGALAGEILKVYPKSRALVYDLAHALDGAHEWIADPSVLARIEFVIGNFFDTVPEGADVLLLKSILHNWRDDKAKLILANCRKAMKPDAKLLLFERIMPEVVEENPVHQARVTSDLNMLVGLSGRERTERELRELLEEAGLRWINEVKLLREFSMVEVVIA